MGIIKVVAIVLVSVLAIGIIGTAIGVGTGVVRYMAAQNFDFQQAISWAWKEYTDWLNKINPLTNVKKGDVIEYQMVNQHIDVVACTDL